MATERLFEPLQVGKLNLNRRIVMAPLTRLRGTADHVPGPYAKQYYRQRASVPGTFMLTEGTFITARVGGAPFIPGIWNDDQINGWKEVTEAVHAKGSFIFLQIAAIGRAAIPAILKKEGGFDLVGPSAIPMNADSETPTALTDAEIREYINDFATAARNAMKAGFDGVEIHGGNGYLVDQSWQDVSNRRTDSWGGCVENRARFGLEIAKAVIAAVGDCKKVAIRLSPWSTYQGMRMADPVPQFLHIVKELKKLDLAYLHLVESRISGGTADGVYHDLNNENDPFVQAWGKETPITLAGGFTAQKALKVATELYPDYNICFAFGRHFIANPDLPFRIRYGVELNKYDRSTFYKPQAPEGYIDYPFCQKLL